MRDDAGSSITTAPPAPLLGGAVLSHPAFLWVTMAVVVLALMFGSARSGDAGAVVTELSGLPLLILLLIGWIDGEIDAGTRRALTPPALLIAGGVGLVLLQLVPLPPSLWTILPGRESLADVFQTLGEVPWQPISMDPGATLRSVLSLLPAVPVFLAVAVLDWRSRRRIVLLVLAVGLIEVLIGLGQQAQRSGAASGFFLNRNQFAALLYCLIPLAAAWWMGLRERGLNDIVVRIALVIVMATLMLGLGVARSRAGLALGLAAGAAALVIAWNRVAAHQRTSVFILVGAGALLGLFLIGEYALGGVLGRFEQELSQDLRLTFVERTLVAIPHYLPFGSGLGTFVPIYSLYEDPSVILSVFANHAHNDWLELTLELGVPAVILLVLAMIWLARATIRAWRHPDPEARHGHVALARAGSVICLLLLIHSLVDYPLRASALSTLFAIGAACLIPARALPKDNGPDTHHRSSSRSHRHRSKNGGQRWLALTGD